MQPSAEICESSPACTHSLKCPCRSSAIVMAVSLPKTWTATIVIASHWVGLTLPGMMDEPGSFSGNVNSPKPQRGPDANQRMSLAIFVSEAASVLSTPLAKIISSWAESAANLFGCDLNGSPVNSAIRRAARSPNSGCEFSPVPTAVPPIAKSNSPGKASCKRSMSRSSRFAQPDSPAHSHAWRPEVVRPFFTTSLNSLPFPQSRRYVLDFRNQPGQLLGRRDVHGRGKRIIRRLRHIHVVFGWTGVLLPRTRRISIARFEITSWQFIFVCVPLPVCQTLTESDRQAYPRGLIRGCSSVSVCRSEVFPALNYDCCSLFRMPSARSFARHTIVADGKWIRLRWFALPNLSQALHLAHVTVSIRVPVCFVVDSET